MNRLVGLAVSAFVTVIATISRVKQGFVAFVPGKVCESDSAPSLVLRTSTQHVRLATRSATVTLLDRALTGLRTVGADLANRCSLDDLAPSLALEDRAPSLALRAAAAVCAIGDVAYAVALASFAGICSVSDGGYTCRVSDRGLICA